MSGKRRLLFVSSDIFSPPIPAQDPDRQYPARHEGGAFEITLASPRPRGRAMPETDSVCDRSPAAESARSPLFQ